MHFVPRAKTRINCADSPIKVIESTPQSRKLLFDQRWFYFLLFEVLLSSAFGCRLSDVCAKRDKLERAYTRLGRAGCFRFPLAVKVFDRAYDQAIGVVILVVDPIAAHDSFSARSASRFRLIAMESTSCGARFSSWSSVRSIGSGSSLDRSSSMFTWRPSSF